MKKKFRSVIQPGRVSGILGCLVATALGVSAQEAGVAFNTAVAANTNQSGGFGFALRAFQPGAPGPATAGFMMVMPEAGPALVKAFDSDQDGGVSSTELKFAAATWFKHWDTDTNSVLTLAELTSGLKAFFPLPEVPAGLPQPPEEARPNALLAKKLTVLADVNTDGYVVFDELAAFLDQNFPRWDQDGDGKLVASECSAAVQGLMLPDGATGVFFQAATVIDAPALK